MQQEFVSKQIIGAMLGVDVRTVYRYQCRAADPLPIAVRGGGGKPHQYDLHAVHIWAIREAQPSGTDSGHNRPNLEHQRARLTAARAEAAELETAALRGQLISVNLIRSTWSEMVTNMRARLLALPAKTAPLVAAAHGVIACRAVLSSHINEALNEIANDGTPTKRTRRNPRPGTRNRKASAKSNG